MAWQMPDEPFVDPDPSSALETIIMPRTRDLGDGFEVRRALPSMRRRMVGPFIFFDQMGPAVFRSGHGLDVRPHPHIGLATVTYLFEGQVLHRDSLGTVQTIQPGAVNWMVAGRGITHSERTPPGLRASGGKLYGIQIWVAAPKTHEEIAPGFAHTPAEALPVVEDAGARVRVIAGGLYGARSPVSTLSELFYADAVLAAGARLQVRASHEERAAYVAEGLVELEGQTYGPGQLLIFRPGAEVVVTASAQAGGRVLLFGGEPMDGPRHIWWNFVSSSRERIEQAKEDWKSGRMAAVPGETDFIPLPEPEPSGVARYP
ncbi:pirin family protein [Pyxidicoccus sp. MSG2]|uniref:pirin family protein n=1 Tax=Pyxidicoccus sp. MSG2 TaxID=2996790 RepID=UPI002271620B|nr:pirin family protein [Pyxidicoccus sp. MSG2]MCY1014188.1 pirin family protein [Pyxidicoccus sp. MSG2]